MHIFHFLISTTFEEEFLLSKNSTLFELYCDRFRIEYKLTKGGNLHIGAGRLSIVEVSLVSAARVGPELLRKMTTSRILTGDGLSLTLMF